MNRNRWKAAYAAARKALRRTGRPRGPADVKACLKARQTGDHLAELERSRFEFRPRAGDSRRQG